MDTDTAFRIDRPCHEDWDAMTPEAGGRRCEACERVVVDLTSLPPGAARDLLERRTAAGERVCVRAHAAPDGRLRLPPGRRSRRRRLTPALAALLGMGASLGLAACQEAEPVMGTPAPVPPPAVGPERPSSTPTMGEVCVPPPVHRGPPPPGPVLMGDVAAPAAPPMVEAPAPDATVLGRVVAPR